MRRKVAPSPSLFPSSSLDSSDRSPPLVRAGPRGGNPHAGGRRRLKNGQENWQRLAFALCLQIPCFASSVFLLPPSRPRCITHCPTCSTRSRSLPRGDPCLGHPNLTLCLAPDFEEPRCLLRLSLARSNCLDQNPRTATAPTV